MHVDPGPAARIDRGVVQARFGAQQDGITSLAHFRRVEAQLDGALLARAENDAAVFLVDAFDRLDVPRSRGYLRDARAVRRVEQLDVAESRAVARPEQLGRSLERDEVGELGPSRRAFGRDHARRESRSVDAHELATFLVARQGLEEERASVGRPSESADVPLVGCIAR
jgi:hypothetical protein